MKKILTTACLFVATAVAIVFFIAPSVFGQEKVPAKGPSRKMTVIRAGNLFDPATGAVSKDTVILIQDGKILEVGSRIKVPEGAEVIDLSRSWVMPGLMDAHTHLSANLPSGNFYQTLPGYYATDSTARRALLGLRNARIVLEAGFTAVRDVGNEANYAMTDVRRAIQEGWFVGPTILNAGKIIAAFGGQTAQIAPEHGPIWQFEYIDADNPDVVRKAVVQNRFYGAGLIKLVDSGRFSEANMRIAVEEAHRIGLKVAVHTGFQGARKPILAGADSIEHGDGLPDELLQLMKEKGTVLVPRAMPYEHWVGQVPDPKSASEDSLSVLRRAHKIGVKMVFGADVIMDLPDKTRADMIMEYVEVWDAAGIPRAQILKSMTTDAAELLGIQKVRGAIAPGLAADIIAMPESPLESIRALRKVNFVMKDGRLIKPESDHVTIK